MAASGQITVTYQNVDEVIARLAILESDCKQGKGVPEVSSTGEGAAALVALGGSLDACAKALGGVISRTRSRLQEAKADYQDADFAAASRMEAIARGQDPDAPSNVPKPEDAISPRIREGGANGNQ